MARRGGRRGTGRGASSALLAALVLVGCGAGSDGSPPGSAAEPSSASAPDTTASSSVVDVEVDGTLERQGDDLVGKVTVTNDGPDRVWVPVGPEGATRPRLLPAAAGAGVVDVGWVVPPAATAVEGVGAFVFRLVEPDASLDLEATDAPPPPEALVDTAGEPVQVDSYRLCVDAFADSALPTERTALPSSTDVVVDASQIDGESERTCGPTTPA